GSSVHRVVSASRESLGLVQPGRIQRTALPMSCSFFFNDPPPTEIYTLSLHDALPISVSALAAPIAVASRPAPARLASPVAWSPLDRKSTRLNSSHVAISYAVFCLKKKNTDLDAASSRIGNVDMAISKA